MYQTPHKLSNEVQMRYCLVDTILSFYQQVKLEKQTNSLDRKNKGKEVR